MSGNFESMCEKQGLLWRHCGSCKEKTEHREEDIDESKYTIICSKCGRVIKKQRPPKKRVSVSEQYEGDVPLLSNESRGCLSLSGGKKYPHCVVHGALLRYEHNIWRCAVCGFAVRWVREIDDVYLSALMREKNRSRMIEGRRFRIYDTKGKEFRKIEYIVAKKEILEYIEANNHSFFEGDLVEQLLIAPEVVSKVLNEQRESREENGGIKIDKRSISEEYQRASDKIRKDPKYWEIFKGLDA